jgi:uncharacterized SAM-binding protein YcdF (DUF218 family)
MPLQGLWPLFILALGLLFFAREGFPLGPFVVLWCGIFLLSFTLSVITPSWMAGRAERRLVDALTAPADLPS